LPLPTDQFAIKKVARGEQSRARALALPQQGMAASAAAAAAAMRLISAHIRVLGEAYVHLWFPAPAPEGCRVRLRRGRGCRPRGRGYHRRARRAFIPDVYLRMAEHDSSTEGGHRQGDGGGVDRAVCAP